MNFSTKARTLELLANRVKQARILPQIRFSLNDWNLNRQGVIDRIEEPAWKNQTCIVRSSALNEDNATKSQAGHYLSVAGVYGRQEMIQAIERVAASFDPPNDQDEIFIQPMLENIRLCGVAFTMDPSNLGHYFVLNYDQTSGSTSSVTAGNSNELNTFYHSKTAKEDPKGDHGRIIGLLWEL
ncbi:MAG TPA: phosphoenolpyruvate synthase, partial [Magnetococcales bacterium]|nr:phosphoenolpyruvate synthase [Magnetococcales bacterium]